MSTLAYLDQNMRLHVKDMENSKTRSIEAPTELIAWPGWSPSGDHLLFSGFSGGNNGHRRLELYLQDMRKSEPRMLFTNEPGTDGLGPSTPHYSTWSPDEAHIAFLARTRKGELTLFIVDPMLPNTIERMIGGSPSFLCWSPDSRFLLAHIGENHFLADFQNHKSVVKLPSTSSLYMAPSWSPIDNRMAILEHVSDDRQELLIGDVGEGRVDVIAEMYGRSAFSWSPNGDYIAMLRAHHHNTPFYSGLWIVATNGAGEHQLSDELNSCFFWSPDGSKIAFISAQTETQGAVRWAVVDVNGGNVQHLTEFSPTEEQMNLFIHFDQYSLSHNPWSPDSHSLVFAGAPIGETSSQEPPLENYPGNVYVLNVDGDKALNTIASGVFGTWQPQSAAT